MRPAHVWVLALALQALFCLWYTNLGGPLSSDEVATYLERARANGFESERLEALRAFLESDTGDDLVMVNVIQMREPPAAIEGVEPGESALDRYMAYMWPALLRRACHPVLAGPAVADALDVWGVENGRVWSSAGMMRYRSRRDMMEIATAPGFDAPHEFKRAAMEKTIAFPIEPFLMIGDLRLLLGLLLFSLAAGLHLWMGRGPPRAGSLSD